MDLIIKPVDVWLFRDGRPFSAGEDHEALSIFPPTPFTLQGAIRTKVLSDKGIDLTGFAKQKNPDPDVGYGENFGKLQLLGPMLVHKKEGKWERLIPMPADVVKVGKEFKLLKPQKLQFKTNLPEKLELLWVKGQRIEDAKGWLPESEWQRYLQGDAQIRCLCGEKEDCICNKLLFSFEPRIGIAIERSKRTTQTRMLYRANFIRLQDKVALWAKVEGVNLKNHGFLRFGSEGKAASCEVIGPLPNFTSYNQNFEKRFKVVLISPAWFSEGYQPSDWSKIFKVPVRLVAIALSRPQKIGGFDVAKGQPKPLRNFVSAGSVYFFETDEKIEFSENFRFTETPKDVVDVGGDWGKIGFGACLIGRW